MQIDPESPHAEPVGAAPVVPTAKTASDTSSTSAPLVEPGDIAVPRAPELSPAACAARLAESFPALFAVLGSSAPVKPIKLRIQVDIQQRAPGVFSKRVLSIFLSRYTTTNAYLKALTLAPHRFDLDGQPAGDISEEHRQLAAEELARRRDIHLARRAAERDAQREAQRAQEAAVRQAHAAGEQARRDRASLLRAFETTTLTLANFCALKGLVAADLEAQLARARQERTERPPEPERFQLPQAQRPEWRDRRDNRPSRPDARRSGPRNGDPPKPQH